ncbi:phosphatase [Plasmodium ovale wallikeri]|uniref:Phosphatase n=1 Tax=Plasmodium ovale wallikeri TaxID=864142 RepID=A0A1A8YG65_PLAOA|nr:phosphatase [Plasmodium ovale wallikeri]SBT31005.1 phosphatase [Plasmodium ovale wallikeri]
MLSLYAPTLLSLGHLITTVRCMNVANFVLFGGSGGSSSSIPDYDSKNDNNSISNDKKKKKIEEHIDEHVKMNLRSKKGSNLNPIFTNNEENINYYLMNNGGNYEELYAKYPLCEAKYKLVDKMKGLNIFHSIMNKTRKIALVKNCIMEMYGILYVTIRNTNDVLSVVATVYGYVPLILILMTIIGLLATFDKYLLYFSFIIPTQFTVNDLILKNILKINRPINSALNSYGMPSGHSCIGLSLLTFILLHLTEEKIDKWSILTYISAVIILLPLPWSRVHIEDHTIYQVIFGSILGAFIGTIFFLIKKHFAKHKEK